MGLRPRWRRSVFRARSLLRRERNNVECVYLGLHHFAERAVNELMTLEGVQTGEAIGHDVHAKMSLALASAGMADVQVAVIDELNSSVGEVLKYPSTDAVRPIVAVHRPHAFGDSDESAGTFDAIQTH